MSYPSNQQELEASLTMTAETIERLNDLLRDLPPLVKLDALLNVYIRQGEQHDQLEKVATSLIEIGGSILLRRPRQSSALQEPAETDQFPAPSTLH